MGKRRPRFSASGVEHIALAFHLAGKTPEPVGVEPFRRSNREAEPFKRRGESGVFAVHGRDQRHLSGEARLRLAQ